MKIIRLEAQNILNIKAIEIQADGKSVTLSGKNEVGKSSILDTIMMTLTGKMVERPIKDGETRAEVTVDLGDYKVKRVWTEAGNRLEITSTTKEGAIVQHKSPQALINGILGQLAFDPLAFKGMEAKVQRELLMKLVGLDFAKEAQVRQDLYNERTAKNRILGNYQSNILLSKAPEAGLPDKEISLTDELQKIQALEDKRKAFADAVAEKKRLTDKIATCETEAKDIQIDCNNDIKKLEVEAKDIQDECDKRVKELEEEIAWTKKGAVTKIENLNLDKQDLINNAESTIENVGLNKKAAQEVLKNLVVPEEIPQDVITKAKEELSKVEITNSKIRNAVAYKEWSDKARAAEKEVNDITAKIKAIDKDKVEKIKTAQYPVAGLGITDDCVIYNNIPFSQASEGAKVRVSTSIAMKLNPTLRLIIIREGSLLDSDGMKAVMDMAKENDYQVFIECVSDEKELVVKIED
jgi:hypothetical protein